MSAFRKDVREAKTDVRRHESWHAQVEGFDVIVHLEESGRKRISVYEINTPDRAIRLGFIDFNPTHVDALDRLADAAPALLRGIAALLRSEGVGDMRDKYEIEMEAMRERLLKGYET